MNERISVAVLAVLTLLSLWIAPWAAIARPTGARSSVVLLPYRFIDFSGRTDPLPIAGLTLVLWVSVICLLVIAAAAFFKGQMRHRSWLLAGLVLLVATGWGLGNLQRSVRDVRVNLITTSIEEELADPRERTDVEALRGVLERVPNASIDATILKSRQDAGFTIRRLGYGGSGMGLAAFLSFVVGGLAVFFGLRTFHRLGRTVDRILTVIAVPATSILLALLAAAVVILALQPTPTGGDFVIEGWQTALTGRLEVLWYAYLTLFSNSLGTVGGFAESLKFATPLIFTGLAVAFGFQAGLFNIGAPGQMVLGAIFAMLVGLYMPGPRFVVLPLAVLASAVGGGFWGAIPGLAQGTLRGERGYQHDFDELYRGFTAAVRAVLEAGLCCACAAYHHRICSGCHRCHAAKPNSAGTQAVFPLASSDLRHHRSISFGSDVSRRTAA